ncbi:hypothetical protein KEJ17_02070 [Candidatus Bathyarchaeota archaeon]|nr:hypothetical protein [Candidatus Bathyarchaeota archaeon]
MLIEDWLHKKAEEYAHNEILALLLIILGVNLLTTGLLATIYSLGEEWGQLFLTFKQLQSATATLGLILTAAGFSVSSAGFILVIHYDRKKSWYRRQIEDSSIMKKLKAEVKTVDQILEEYVGKKKA